MAKIKIICTEQERKAFIMNSCPGTADWKDHPDCANPDMPCSDCWAQYVDWETTDESL